ncbi:uncharacterized protein CcaverHIS019_0102750 [Cutaneotrichosporon cavernicola]|uniref:CBM21 domain-containing protein n=1 Tax=Cutaneotrichosporon cavernicola TaxID=279322 RepID=A0AA48I7D2_9TREE|nr:uncharacterized protein CcaverHIS019_0102750 [Cutaneotrichosporon cavernicola]BEI87557.1 hypothetical protein CcaverHIS019_0102750 [Cutaneotrichosporon cavernicola]BEI95328.1 hypothetical protein CcaverHIS631_0102770 [Cutaneotrichosporon cavernicola]BEJ03102.1 hypothetical protein CcaverHIS641_0102770 [Cutaneotrichosporon cavernicola]
MPYTAPASPVPDFTSAKLVGAYPTPPPSPLLDELAPGHSPDPQVFARTLKPPRRTPSLPTLRPTSPCRALRRAPSAPSLRLTSKGFRLTTPPGILAVLGGVRVLRVDTASVLDRMPYSPSQAFTTFSARASSATGAVDTERVVAPTSADAKGVDSGVQSESALDTAAVTPVIAPAQVSGKTAKRSVPAPIRVHPPTPTRDQLPPETPPPFAVTPMADLSDSAASSSHTSPYTSPNGSSSSVPTTSSLGITIHTSVLPEVRSPRRAPVEPITSNINRRSRRPRLFGFTGIDHPTAQGSPVTSPESVNTMGAIPRRTVPQRTKSETSIYTLGHASAHQKEPKEPHEPIIHSRPRRDTGLRLDLKGIVAEPVHRTPVSASVIPHRIVRKKSGEAVRSALKPSGPLHPNGTPKTDEKSRAMWESRSCPTTPSFRKNVHFDSQLERVKLFLQDQKPQVVSRQGSPDYSDFESQDESEPEKVLEIKLPNFPTTHPLEADMYLESLFLNDNRDGLRGVIVVRNYSFQKLVAVRFTFDWWHTTSEVSASYQDSIRGGTFDRFTFNIKLGDILERIEEKTLFLCVRYNSDGRELWDSNGGENYQILFDRLNKVAPRSVANRTRNMPKGMRRSRNAWSSTSSNPCGMADLRARLNRLTAEEEALTAPIPRSSKPRFSSPSRGSPHMSPRKLRPSGPATPDAVELPANLGTRYDFGSALKSSHKQSPTIRSRELQPDRHGSGDFYYPIPAFLHGAGPSSPLAGGDSPSSPASPLPFNGVGSPLAGPGTTLPALGGGHSSSTSSLSSVNSIIPTPADSPASVRSKVVVEAPQESPSPSPSPLSTDSPMSPLDVLPWMKSGDDDLSRSSYSTFIEQFCWGGASTNLTLEPSSSTADIRRIHSTSALDSFGAGPDLTPRSYTPTASLSRSTSATEVSSNTATPLFSCASPPTREDLERVDSAIRSLSSSLQSTPVEGSPVIGAAPMTRIPSGNTVLAI